MSDPIKNYYRALACLNKSAKTEEKKKQLFTVSVTDTDKYKNYLFICVKTLSSIVNLKQKY